jgi:hypothetical protein
MANLTELSVPKPDQWRVQFRRDDATGRVVCDVLAGDALVYRLPAYMVDAAQMIVTRHNARIQAAAQERHEGFAAVGRGEWR